MADLGIATNIASGVHATQNQQPATVRVEERATLQETAAPVSATPELSASERAPEVNTVANTANDTRDNVDDPEAAVDLSQLVSRGQAQTDDSPRSQQQIDNQRQQLETIVAAAESPAPESRLEAQA